MTPEGRVKAQVKKILDARKPALWYYMPIPMYNRGIPDIIGVYQGVLFAIETKAGTNTPTALQKKALQSIERAGGHALVVNEQNMDAVDSMLDKISVVCGASLSAYACPLNAVRWDSSGHTYCKLLRR